MASSSKLSAFTRSSRPSSASSTTLAVEGCARAPTGALAHELTLREVLVPIYYKGELVVRQRLDMVVDGCVIVECKATERLPPSAGPQLIGYLRATTFKVGVLLHFGLRPKFYRFVDSIKDKKQLERMHSHSRDSRPKTMGSNQQ